MDKAYSCSAGMDRRFAELRFVGMYYLCVCITKPRIFITNYMSIARNMLVPVVNHIAWVSCFF